MKARGALALAVVPFAVTLALTWAGVDFGAHWDEDFNKVEAVSYSLAHDFTLLPDGYTYPSLNYWITLGALAPELGRSLVRSGPDPAAVRAALEPVIRGADFHLRLRRVYAFFASLAALWIGSGVLAWGGSGLEALAAGLVWATSWEVIYHSRWVAPDAVLAQFGALVLFLLGRAWKGRSGGALGLAAVAAGLGAGTKYPGGALILPVLVAGVFMGGGVRRVGGLALLFGAAYLVTTPGTLLQPLAFYKSLVDARQVYAEGWYGYTVRPGWTHLGKILFYLSSRGLSAFPAAALALSILAGFGVWALVREDPRGAAVVLIFPLAYTAYFALQATMVVRNYLIDLPFAAFLCARGVGWLRSRLPAGWLRLAPAAVVAAIVAIDGADQMRAAASIRHRGDQARFLREFVGYAGRRPAEVFLVSDRLADSLRRAGDWPRPNLVAASARPRPRFDTYAGYNTEIVLPRELDWPSNRPGGFRAVFGAREVNLDYYILWSGNEKILCLSPALGSETGVPRPPDAKATQP